MLVKLCIYLLLPIAFASFLSLLFIYSSPSDTHLPLSTPTKIHRDSLGIPHIHTSSLNDGLYALGYAMCQDRMWQLDMLRRAATGRLSEFFGLSTIETDKFIRNIKLPISAQNDVNALDSETRKLGESFVNGINDAAVGGWLPVEYYLTGSKWENFTLADSQATIYLISVYLSMIWGTDVQKVQMKALGLDVETLIPVEIDLLNPKAFIVDDEELPEELRGPKENLKSSEFKEFIEFYTELSDLGSGSNGWVISGNHTKSGKPILSNDPHLSTSIPSLWYLHSMQIGEYKVFGACSVGFPLVTIGRNNKFVWGVTASKMDDIDVYAEKMVNSTHYWFGEQIFEVLQFRETIKIKGQPAEVFDFKETVHGPMLENSIVGVKRFTPNFPDTQSKFLSFCWSSHGFFDKSLALVQAMVTIQDVQELRKVLLKTTAVKLSMYGASTSGDIFYQAIGKIPVRRYKSDMVLPGWDLKTMWKGFIPAQDMPYTINPSKGFIVTANNFVTNRAYKYFESSGTYFSQGRADRITSKISSLIQSGHKFTAEESLELLKDEFETFASRLLPTIIGKVRTKKYQKVLDEFKEWDFVMSRGSRTAAVYAKWCVEIAKALLRNKAPLSLVQAYTRNNVLHSNLNSFFAGHYRDVSKNCDDPLTERNETCEEMLSEAFEVAAEFVGERKWGEMHAVVLKHLPFSQSSVLSWIYERKVEVGGWSSSVHATSSDWNSTFNTVHGPGLKFVSDLGNVSANYWSLETGMSGNIFSRHYSDMLQSFHYGQIPRFDYK